MGRSIYKQKRGGGVNHRCQELMVTRTEQGGTLEIRIKRGVSTKRNIRRKKGEMGGGIKKKVRELDRDRRITPLPVSKGPRKENGAINRKGYGG